ncbi:TRAP transporter large permease [Ruicaihuangia caeni]|uniref:TRAP transporter large permease n=1 Tax=Ruicaihuangia caeni TaxID=3042517 RepID=A0AAW6T7Y8_9MICO|nr:TRAP transporter large permease [Klugiella sp. YN-L-19]MDI2099211.1 TRAP transporter large permease [Klugiella sp. YN-L-19]
MIWLLILLVVALIFLRVPIFLSLLAVSVLYIQFEQTAGTIIVQRMSSGLESFPLLAVPLFILAGTIMARGGIAERLMGFATVLVGHFRGGLAQVNVLNSLMIGGMSGSSNADAAIDSKILVPIMRRQGYPNGFASAITAASGSISPILPPSIGLILYGVLANVSIGALFIGGVIPGILIAVALSATVWIISRRRGYPKVRDNMARFAEIWASFVRSLPALLMPVLLIVGLRIGIFTPTELGAIAVVYALVVAFAFRELSIKDIPSLLKEAAFTSAIVMIIIAAAAVFGIIVAYEQIPAQVLGLLTAVSDNPVVLLLMINLLLLVLGIFMESMSLMIILVPVLAPVAASIGVDPVQFGVIIVLNLTIGSITPPVGSVLYTVAAITKVKIGEFTKAFLPFFMALVVVLLLITYIPPLVTWLPELTRGG